MNLSSPSKKKIPRLVLWPLQEASFVGPKERARSEPLIAYPPGSANLIRTSISSLFLNPPQNRRTFITNMVSEMYLAMETC